DERAGYGRHHENGDDLRDEGKCDFLHLGERLEKGDEDTNRHRRADRGAGGDDHGPDRRLNDREGIGLVHGKAQLTETPEPSSSVPPPFSVASGPFVVILTETTSPEVVPSDEVTV